MQDINSVTLVGRLTRDPELRTRPGGDPLCEASIAVNSSTKKSGEWEEYASFFNVTVFGNQATALVKNVKKGQRIAVTGKLLQRRWDTDDGTKRERVQISASSVQFLQGETKRAPAPPPPDDVPF